MSDDKDFLVALGTSMGSFEDWVIEQQRSLRENNARARKAAKKAGIKRHRKRPQEEKQ